MNLFNFGKKKTDSKGKVLAQYDFIQADSFRGFKSVRLTTYDYAPIAESMRKLRKKNPEFTTLDGKEPPYIFDLKGKKITIQHYKYDTGKEDELLMILVNGYQVGTCFTSNMMYKKLLKLLASNKIEGVYVLIETLQEYDKRKDKIVFADDYKSTLFIKIAE